MHDGRQQLFDAPLAAHPMPAAAETAAVGDFTPEQIERKVIDLVMELRELNIVKEWLDNAAAVGSLLAGRIMELSGKGTFFPLDVIELANELATIIEQAPVAPVEVVA